jgi:hypothetical protein
MNQGNKVKVDVGAVLKKEKNWNLHLIIIY